jgi:predicted nucleotidyltransferase
VKPTAARQAPPETAPPADERPFARRDVGPDRLVPVLRDALAALDRAGVPHLVSGGVASSALGRPRWSPDIDVVVAPHDADRALDALAEAGFETERTDPAWLYKAMRDGVLVDLMFILMGRIHLDEPMLEHAREAEFLGQPVRTVSPEDLIVVKAVSHDAESPRHWTDALGLLAFADLDWDYLVERARVGIRRVLALLIYAQSEDLAVPQHVIEALYTSLYGGATAGDG